MARLIFLLAGGYLGLIVLVYFGQRFLQYYPNRSYPGKPANYGVAEMQEIKARTEDGLELLAWFVPPKNKDGKIIVFYHGNAGHIGHRGFKMRQYIDAGYGVYLCEYRGYGGNPGSPDERGLYQDARAGLKWLDENGYTPAQWIIYGESLGSGPAVQMAQEFQPKILILESVFSSAVDVGKKVYFWLPVDLLLKDRYDNISKIKSIRSSLLMLHGDEDEVIPYALGKKLYDAANDPKQLVTIERGNHNDLYEHHAGHIILEWLENELR